MHVSYEGLGCIETWIRKNNHSVSYSKLYEGSKLPELEDFDWLIVMGGPMGVYDESNFPWLKAEKKLIRQAIDSDKTVIGICLGSQLIAEVLGTKVFSNNQKEIGWFDIQQVFENRNHPILKSFIPKFPVFHWHGDTFDLPTGSIRLFESEVCTNQAFIYQENVLGLQFHFEVTAETMKEMLENGKEELVKNETIQSAEEILLQAANIEVNNQRMFSILDYFQQKTSDHKLW
jgi:GMP synthase-like glutamine amidotransferase